MEDTTQNVSKQLGNFSFSTNDPILYNLYTSVFNDNNNLKNRIEILEKDNTTLINKLEVSENNLKHANEVIITSLTLQNDKLKGDIKELEAENIELRKKITLLEKNNVTLTKNIDELMTDKQNTINLNKLSDVYRYFKDYIVYDEINENYTKYDEKFAGLETYQMLDCLDVKNNDRRKDKLINKQNMISLLNKLEFDPCDILEFKYLNGDRNTLHYIDKNRYGDKKYMLERLTEFKDMVDKLNSNNDIYTYKDRLLRFTVRLSELTK